MDQVIFLHLYDSAGPVGPVGSNLLNDNGVVKGLSRIDIKGSDEIIKKIKDKGVMVPSLLIYYKDRYKIYEYNIENLNRIKNILSQLFDNL